MTTDDQIPPATEDELKELVRLYGNCNYVPSEQLEHFQREALLRLRASKKLAFQAGDQV